ncbi:hypothetical protein KY348_06470 [Candidatus Woesearchaeota archaeon]|nr:hypothetical protein [Candidatus Woesearchaeota archaeon]
MKKHLYILTFILFLFALCATAEPVSIELKLPADGSVIITYTQDFIYSFDQYVDILNCSLIVDDEVKKVRNTLFRINDNKITVELEAGKHDWFMKCYDIDFNEILSETRTLSVNTGEEIKESYETFYYSSGLRGYVFTIEPGQSPVELPALKGGEDIQIKLSGKTYYLDIIKMGVAINTSFVEVRDRSTGVKHRMLVPGTLSFDFDDDETVDVELSLTEVDRSVDAYFVVTPYPDTVVEEAIEEEEEEAEPVPEEEPETEEEPEVIEEVEEGEDLLAEQEPEEEVEEPEVEEETVVTPSPKPEKKSKTWLIILIIAIILIIILVIILLVAKRKKKKVTELQITKEEKQQKSEIFESPSGRKQKSEIFESPSGRKQKSEIFESPSGRKQKSEIFESPSRRKPEKKVVKQPVKQKKTKEKKAREPKVKKKELKPKMVKPEESPEPEEAQPVFDESFDIIKSTGRKMKK